MRILRVDAQRVEDGGNGCLERGKGVRKHGGETADEGMPSILPVIDFAMPADTARLRGSNIKTPQRRGRHRRKADEPTFDAIARNQGRNFARQYPDPDGCFDVLLAPAVFAWASATDAMMSMASRICFREIFR